MFMRLLLLMLSWVLIANCNADTPKWELGKHYFAINPAQPTSTGDKVEVLEVFSYACPHCAHFQTYAEQIKASLPKEATFAYMPAIFQPTWEPFARAFYTAQALGIAEKSHQALFDAVHRDHKSLHTIEELAGFYADYGVKPEAFLSTARSFVIESQMAHAVDMVSKYGVEGTPTLIVNGKYRVAASAEAGVGYPEVVEIVDTLVKQEIAGKKAK